MVFNNKESISVLTKILGRDYGLDTIKGLQAIAKDIAGTDIELPIPNEELTDLVYDLFNQECLDEEQVNSAIIFSLTVLNTIAIYLEG